MFSRHKRIRGRRLQEYRESQNLVEIQQWNIRQDGSGYRVQDMYDYTLDTFGMVDQ